MFNFIKTNSKIDINVTSCADCPFMYVGIEGLTGDELDYCELLLMSSKFNDDEYYKHVKDSNEAIRKNKVLDDCPLKKEDVHISLNERVK